MLLFTACSAPFFGGFLGSALAVCIVGLVLVVQQRKAIALPEAHDPEREYQRLKMKLRQPWKSRLRRLFSA